MGHFPLTPLEKFVDFEPDLSINEDYVKELEKKEKRNQRVEIEKNKKKNDLFNAEIEKTKAILDTLVA